MGIDTSRISLGMVLVMLEASTPHTCSFIILICSIGFHKHKNCPNASEWKVNLLH